MLVKSFFNKMKMKIIGVEEPWTRRSSFRGTFVINLKKLMVAMLLDLAMDCYVCSDYNDSPFVINLKKLKAYVESLVSDICGERKGGKFWCYNSFSYNTHFLQDVYVPLKSFFLVLKVLFYNSSSVCLETCKCH
ncbi:hypothetical protein MtrunA17_Chr2g0280561 [Medicago truncatula]|uniref:Uncharacterized protein n=1 Tax=Medicago truncatula TaxID=3880 RepID=A0A396J4T4_MEDTR|nr:hypothetical protein MtrunA17_Chr2g0280561 [Medicago truncatula]